MGKVTEKVEDLLRGNQDFAKLYPAAAGMQELYLKLLREGVISKPEYDLPLLDTVGCRVANSTRQRHGPTAK